MQNVFISLIEVYIQLLSVPLEIQFKSTKLKKFKNVIDVTIISSNLEEIETRIYVALFCSNISHNTEKQISF